MTDLTWLTNMELPFEKLRGSDILVTGANGMIASDLCETLILLNEEMDLDLHVHALCRNKENALKRLSRFLDKDCFELLIQDVSEPLETGKKYDYIFHLASSANPSAFNEHPVEVMKANFIGTMNMLEQVRNNGGRLVFVSSSEVYGENFDEKELFKEEDQGQIDYFRFRACYPESKRASETLCKCYEKEYDTDVVIARPAFIYGRSIIDSNNRADVYFLRQAMNHEDIVMYSEGSQIRSYCYVNDCISGFLFIALLGEKGEAYNIGNMDCVVTMKEYAQTLADMADINLTFDFSKAPKDKVMLKTVKLILDTHKLEALGWNAQYDLKAGFKDIFQGD
ncbi:MAG: NAD-dependent epimerase/dehydratase family protein [Erysipelotrichaceae bacterium]|nr:NAD-dependent epimerase/dehydratase family protein [Erysipelotrichaceae bacterium]